MLDKLTSADFLPHLHTLFPVLLESSAESFPDTHDTNQLLLELVQVSDLGNELAVAAPRSRAFSLIFREAKRTYLPQGIYTIEHPVLGQSGLFIVPIGQDASGILYQAIFT